MISTDPVASPLQSIFEIFDELKLNSFGSVIVIELLYVHPFVSKIV